MYMFQFIDFRIFLVALAIGLFYIYILDDDKQTIIIYPTPDNLNEYQYKDKSDNCFSYEMNEIKCPTDDTLFHTIKVQS